MKTVNLNTNQERSFFKQLRDRVGASAIISPSQLRVAVLVENARGNYTFNLKKDVGNALLHDKKLDYNDSFAATKWGIGLLCEDPTKPGTGLVQSYPNNIVFPAQAGEVTPAHLNIFFNGNLRYKKDDSVQIEAWPTRLSYCARTTQQSAPGNFSENFGEDGTVQLPQLVTFDGAAKNEVTLEVPTWGGLQAQYATPATRIYVVFQAFGFLITGVSRISNK